MTMTIRAGSREPMLIPVSAEIDDPLAADVSIAVVDCDAGEPAGAAYKPADWVVSGGETLARANVGPGSDVGPLAPGLYRVWVRIVANPVDVRLEAGGLTIR